MLNSNKSVLATAVAALAAGLASTSPGQVTRRMSVSSSGAQGNSSSWSTPNNSMTPDGRRVVFQSAASNLVPGDTNGVEDVFVRDRLTGVTTRVSVSTSGGQSDSYSNESCISADGRYVAFTSEATNLVPGDTNLREDCFVHDLVTHVTTRVSVASGGAQGHGENFTFLPTLSGDGRYVAFVSALNDLVPGDSNGVEDVFVHDRVTGTTARASVSGTGAQGNGFSHEASLSVDGRFVVFLSSASNLVPGDTNGQSDVFLRDRDFDADGIFDETEPGAVETRIISRSSSGVLGNGSAVHFIGASPDARYIVFNSSASNLVAGDTNGMLDAFLADRTGVTGRASLDWLGDQLATGTMTTFWETASIGATPRFIAFVTDDSNVIRGGLPPGPYMMVAYVRDMHSGAVYQASPSLGSTRGNSYYPALAGDGRTVAFTSFDANLIPDDTNGLVDDVYVRTIGPDGRADWELLPLAIQDTQTSLGDSTLGDPVNANGSELDAAYAMVDGDYLHLSLAGNLQGSGPALQVFVDCAAGGQSRLLANNPNQGSLPGLSDDGSGNGLRFDAGFEPDYYLFVGPSRQVRFATLPTGGGGTGIFLGAVPTDGAPGTLVGGDNSLGILCSIDNSNTAGVTAGASASTGSGVRTGVEFAIPLAALADSQCEIRVCAFLTDDDVGSTISNQVLGPVGGRAALGPSRAVNLGLVPGQQFFSVSPSVRSFTNLQTPAPQAEAQYGRGIALKSGRLLIGSRRFDRPGANDSGALFTSEQISGVWTPPVQVSPSTLPAAGDRFGWAVATDQNWAFVGAPNRDSAGSDAGAVWVFERTGANAWIQRAILTAPDAQAGANFGYSVDLVFDRAIVGAPNHDGIGADSGKAYVYQRAGSSWNLAGQLAPADGAAGDQFGFDVGVSGLGTEVIVGAPGDDRPGLTNAGAAYIFQRSGSTWPNVVTRRLEHDAALSGQRLGAAVALANSFAAAGAPDVGTGQVTVFIKGNSTWSIVHPEDLAPADGQSGDLFGFSLAATNSLLVVGAPNGSDPFFDSGAVYTYGYDATIESIRQRGKVTAPDSAPGDALGGDVALDGLTLAAGAGGFDVGGTAYAFDLALSDPVVLRWPSDAEYPEGTFIVDLVWSWYTPAPGTARVFFEGSEIYSQPMPVGEGSLNLPHFELSPSTAGTYRVSLETPCVLVQSETTTITITPPSCPADFNGDGFVTGDDFDEYVAAFESGEPSADFNGDSFVTGDDFDLFVQAFEDGC